MFFILDERLLLVLVQLAEILSLTDLIFGELILILEHVDLPVFDVGEDLSIPLAFALIVPFIELSALVSLITENTLEHSVENVLTEILRKPLPRKIFWDGGRMLLVQFVEVLQMEATVVYVQHICKFFIFI